MYINLHSSYCILRITENSRSNNVSKYLKRTNKYISEITKIYRIIKCDWQKKKNDIFKNNISCNKICSYTKFTSECFVSRKCTINKVIDHKVWIIVMLHQKFREDRVDILHFLRLLITTNAEKFIWNILFLCLEVEVNKMYFYYEKVHFLTSSWSRVTIL